MDLICGLKRKNDYAELAEATRTRAEKAGRNFREEGDRLYWPMHEVQLALKAKSRIISLHNEGQLTMKGLKFRVLMGDHEYVRREVAGERLKLYA